MTLSTISCMLMSISAVFGQRSPIDMIDHVKDIYDDKFSLVEHPEVAFRAYMDRFVDDVVYCPDGASKESECKKGKQFLNDVTCKEWLEKYKSVTYRMPEYATDYEAGRPMQTRSIIEVDAVDYDDCNSRIVMKDMMVFDHMNDKIICYNETVLHVARHCGGEHKPNPLPLWTLGTKKPTPSPVWTKKPTPSPVGTKKPTPSPVWTKKPTPSPVWTKKPTPSPVWTKKPTPSPVWTKKPTPSPVWTKKPTPSPVWTKKPTPSPVWTKKPTPSPVWTKKPTPSPVWTKKPTPSPVWTKKPTPSPVWWQHSDSDSDSDTVSRLDQ